MLNNYTINFRDTQFDGLKFRSNHGYSGEYFDELLTNPTEENEIKHKKGVDEVNLEDIHIKISYSLLLKAISPVFLVGVLIFSLNQMLIPAIISLVISASLFFISWRLVKIANSMYLMRGSTSGLLGMIYDDERKEQNENNKTED